MHNRIKICLLLLHVLLSCEKNQNSDTIEYYHIDNEYLIAEIRDNMQFRRIGYTYNDSSQLIRRDIYYPSSDQYYKFNIYTYNSFGKVKKCELFETEKIDGEIDTTFSYERYEYDNKGRLVKVIDQYDHEFEYTYDDNDLLRIEHIHGDTLSEFFYDDSLNVVEEYIHIFDEFFLPRVVKTRFMYDTMPKASDGLDYIPRREFIFDLYFDRFGPSVSRNNLIRVDDYLEFEYSYNDEGYPIIAIGDWQTKYIEYIKTNHKK